ncbi:MAG: hypothetical protein WCP21_07425 [Armatimonadota bacterium]
MKLFVWYYPSAQQLAAPAAADAVVEKLQRLRATGVYFMIPEAQVLAEPDPWRALGEKLREAGLEIQLGFLPFSEPPDPTPEMLRRRYVYVQDGKTRHDGLCPAWPENRLLALHRAQQLCDLLQPTALHLDHLRYHFASNQSFGQNLEWEEGGKWVATYHHCACALCQTERLELLGREPNEWDRHHPGYVFKRLQQRAEHVEEVLRGLRRLGNERGLKLTCAVRSQYLARALVEGQDWVRWCKEGLLDSISPLNYSPALDTVLGRFKENQRLLQHLRIEVLEGLARQSSAGQASAEQLAEQVRRVVELGAPGVALCHLETLTDEDCALLGAQAGL